MKLEVATCSACHRRLTTVSDVKRAAKTNMALANMKTGNQAHAYISNIYPFTSPT
jgi:hypothetical protein